MRPTTFLNGKMAKLLVKSVAGFLAMLATLMTVHYPVLPENVLALYSADRTEALNLGRFLSILAFAASVIVVFRTWRSVSNQTSQTKPAKTGPLLRVGVLLLLVAGLGCVAHFTVIRISVSVALAISEAQEREISDWTARNTLVTLHDPTLSPFAKYNLATDFLDAERIPYVPTEEVLSTAKEPPFEGAFIATYAATLLCFKLGLFFVAAGLALPPSPGKKDRRKNRGPMPERVANGPQEISS